MAADPGLVSYILRYHEQGYDVNTLRNTLAQQGYNPQVIEEAITEATRQGKVVQQKLPVGKTHGNMILLIGVVLVGLIGIGIFGLFFLGGEEEEEIYVPTPTERPPPVETAPAEPIAPVEPVQPVAPIAPVTSVEPAGPVEQLPTTPMGADELKLEILRNTKRIKNYGFIEDIVITLHGNKITIKNDGSVDRENEKLSGTFDNVDVFMQDEFVYSKMGDSWVREDLEEGFFPLEREISLLEESDIGILNEDPLEILVSFNKEIIGEEMARELFAEQTAFFDNYYIDYEEALTIDADFDVDMNLVVQKIESDITLTANNLTVMPKNGVMFNESYIMEINTTITFLSFNTIADIIVPGSVINESISLDDYLEGLVVTPPINVTGTNVTGTNTTGNETGNQTT